MRKNKGRKGREMMINKDKTAEIELKDRSSNPSEIDRENNSQCSPLFSWQSTIIFLILKNHITPKILFIKC